MFTDNIKIYKKSTVGILLLSLPAIAFSDSHVTFDGVSSKVIEITPEKSTGLNNIFVVRDMAGVTIRYRSDGQSVPRVYRYSNLGGAYSEEVRNTVYSAPYLEITGAEGDYGYIVEDGDSRYYFWIVDYSKHRFDISSVSVSSASDCSYSVLDLICSAGPIHYFTINGQQKVLSRDIDVEYTTQEFDAESSEYVLADRHNTYESLSSTLNITPPAYCSTFFTVSGDRFLREWGEMRRAESSVAAPVAVDCSTAAVQTESGDENSNIIKGDDTMLGGSAPAEISFYAYTTEGVIHHEWQMGRDPNFDSVEYRFNVQDLTYTFDEEGTFYLQYIGSNSDGTCEAFGDVYTVNIGASELLCPNAFSPNDDGINDVWKVSYRSLTDFHCWIFDRNGQELYSFDKPDGGWDGKYHGKLVRPGVYYYVIQAEGADGKKYKKSGDINIIRSNSSTKTSGTQQ